jgi:hypothetical protein
MTTCPRHHRSVFAALRAWHAATSSKAPARSRSAAPCTRPATGRQSPAAGLPPAPGRDHRPRRPDCQRAARCETRRRWPHQPRDRPSAVYHRQNRQGAPQPRLPQARDHAPRPTCQRAHQPSRRQRRATERHRDNFVEPRPPKSLSPPGQCATPLGGARLTAMDICRYIPLCGPGAHSKGRQPDAQRPIGRRPGDARQKRR